MTTFPTTLNFFIFPQSKNQIGHVIYQSTQIDETDIMVKEFLTMIGK